MQRQPFSSLKAKGNRLILNLFRKIRESFSRPEPAPKAETPKADHRKESAPKRPEPEAARAEKAQPAPKKPQGRKPKSDRKARTETAAPAWDISQFVVEPEEGKTRFHDLGIPNRLMHAIHDMGFSHCTPIQAGSLPETLKGRDCTGQAQTGTGKTAAFLINVFTQLLRHPKESRRPGVPRALILAPTRELVIQIEKDAAALGKYAGIRVLGVYGGMNYEKQKRALAETVVDVVVATPGRLIDFKRQGIVKLFKVEILVIDEADRMLDMGFIPDVKNIVYATPKKHERQTLFYSATLSGDVMRLASQWTRDPVMVEIEPDTIATENVDRQNYIVTSREKFPLLYNVITRQKLDRVMVFTNRKSDARYLSEKLAKYQISCTLITGDVPQKKRIRALEDFRNGKFTVLVATDVAARGIHIDGISHVVNYNLPQDPEQFVHRIGRTGRAGTTGISISFADEDDSFYIPAIEDFIGEPFTCVYPEEELVMLPPPPKPKPRPQPKETEDGEAKPAPKRRRRRRPNRNGSGANGGNRENGNGSKPAASKDGKPAGPAPKKAEGGEDTPRPKRRRRRRRPAGQKPAGEGNPSTPGPASDA